MSCSAACIYVAATSVPDSDAASAAGSESSVGGGDLEVAERSEFADRGWFVLLLATIAAVCTGPGQTIGVSVFIDYFVDDLSLSRSEVSVAYLVGTLLAATMLPLVGKMIDRRGVREAQIIIGLAFGVALVNMSFVNGLVWLTVGFLGIRMLGQGSLGLVSTVTVSIRYLRNRGTALGLFATGTAAGMALIPVALALVISRVGWRNAWLVAAGVVVAVVVPIAWFGLRSLPVGTRRVDAESTTVVADESFSRAEAMRTRSFWVLAAVNGAAGMLGTALIFHQFDLLGDVGISKTAAAALFIPQVIGSTLSGLAFGYTADHIGTRFLPAVGMALLIAAMLLASIVQPGVIVVVYAIVLGAMAGGVRTIAATLLPTWFGTEHLGSIQGSLTLFTVASTALGPVVLAVTESWFGSYPPAVLLLTIIPAAALVFSLGTDRHRRPLSAPSVSQIAG
jgi:MFS family permease